MPAAARSSALRAGRRALAAAALALAAGCTPLRVDIAEEPAGGFRAAARGDDAADCRDARARVADEARYHCESRGLRPHLGKVASEPEGAGCRVTLPFWCTGS